jgi:glycosyltransferase involved in cell wall biosynthesis
MPKLTLVVPVFNEESRWSDDYWAFLTQTGVASVLFVNDGSTDRTESILSKFVQLHPNSDVINLKANVGKSEAIRIGFQKAIEKEYELIGFLDADGAFDAQEVLTVLDRFNTEYFSVNSIDAVWSSRVKLLGSNIKRDNSRHYIGRVIHTIIGLWIDDLPYDSQSGFKIFILTQELRKSVATPFKTRWFIDLELLLRLRTMKPTSIIEFPLQSWVDISGSKIGLASSLEVLKDLVKLFLIRERH